MNLVRGRSLRLVKASRKTQLELSEENIPLKILIYIKYILFHHVSILDASMMYSKDTKSTTQSITWSKGQTYYITINLILNIGGTGMSRIGRMPIAVPAGVTVEIAENNHVTVKGPKGTLERTLPSEMDIKLEGEEVVVTRPNDLKKMKSLHGLTRTLINNMVIGVTEGYTKTLEVNGVGYRASKAGKKLTLNLGSRKSSYGFSVFSFYMAISSGCALRHTFTKLLAGFLPNIAENFSTDTKLSGSFISDYTLVCGNDCCSKSTKYLRYILA